MDAEQLDLATRVIGVVLAVMGAGVGAPGGWSQFRGNAARHVRAVRARLHALARRFLRRTTVAPAATRGVGSMTLPMPTMSGTAWVWDQTAGVEAQLAHLRERTAGLRKQLSDLERSSREADAELQTSLDAFSHQLAGEAARIDAAIEDMRASGARAEAWSLPLIALGVALTALSPEISGHGVAVWAVVMVVGVVALPVMWWLVAVRA